MSAVGPDVDRRLAELRAFVQVHDNLGRGRGALEFEQHGVCAAARGSPKAKPAPLTLPELEVTVLEPRSSIAGQRGAPNVDRAAPPAHPARAVADERFRGRFERDLSRHSVGKARLQWPHPIDLVAVLDHRHFGDRGRSHHARSQAAVVAVADPPAHLLAVQFEVDDDPLGGCRGIHPALLEGVEDGVGGLLVRQGGGQPAEL